ncbi:MAG: uracil-DNA glycosylase family protein [Gammaproteobacteria bacterium]
MTVSFTSTIDQVKSCTLCASQLPHEPRPILQLHPKARILIAGQAPGRKVHDSGIPFDDASGRRLRTWLGLETSLFYDPERVAIVPMGLCYPGPGKSGDLPPRPECAEQWRNRLLTLMPDIRLTLLIGRYAQDWHLRAHGKASLTETVKAWREYWPAVLPLPHPSPRNNPWLNNNPWFEADVIPVLRARITEILNRSA